MSYLVLARKYRPRTFEEVVGQEVVTATLAGAIQEERVGHAYLFTGPRGTGKTTCARIFARALLCENGPTPKPCGTCERCRAVEAGTEIDLIEIDAASNNGVENVRDLREQAIYVPLRARFKIYLIDEVHMLSKQAFNALLKTLEEPPPHVKFLFATTEPQKVIETILSRCQILRLSPLEDTLVAARLTEVFEREGIEAEAGVAEEIARRAHGGMRDALSTADQLLSLVGSKPKLADLERLASEGSERTLAAIVEALLAGDKSALLTALPVSEGAEVELVAALLDHLRAALVAGLCGGEAAVLSRSPGEVAALAALAKRIGAPRLELWLAELLHARERMRILPEHSRTILEVTLLDLCSSDASIALAELAERLSALESRLTSGAPATRASPSARASAPAPDSASPPSPAARPSPSTPTADANAPRSRPSTHTETWRAFLGELERSASSLAEILARRGSLRELGGGRAVIRLADLADGERTLLREPRNQLSCSRAFSAACGEPIEVELVDAARARPTKDDAFTREVADLFDGRVEE
jgi:DNA polymerase-3 subunit gamma/tau